MGLMDKVKGVGKEMGIGLNAQEQYHRAYEKGVFLQPPDYASAAKHFATASEKFFKEGNPIMAQRAQANAALYGLISSRDVSAIPEVIRALESVAEIERLGNENEMIQTAPLITELAAIQYEHQAENSNNNAEKIEYYTKAADSFMKLGVSPLQIAERLSLQGPLDKAMLRAFYDSALSDYYSALAVVMASPTQAHDLLQKAAGEFHQAAATDWAKTVDDYIKQVSSKSHCWMCGREMQGKDLFYAYYPARTDEFHTHLLEESNEDLRMIDTPGKVTMCTVCGSIIENQADRYAVMRANEVREWAAGMLNQVDQVLQNHNERLRRLESLAHRH
ncbi:MAG TPA: hypothetical protein PLP57_06515 [Candidatus Saccharicenans sp.]|jgi:hypothetical protein|nr:hypothetical protein [Candidatus Saccharicenans sp.]HRD02279.1 hypothetical protein [Candidatus Saccharicenans sp.]